MAFSNLASNQMVSYLDASSGGFPLNSGQSHYTTIPGANQCMTKSEAFTKYNLKTTANTNGVASNQLMQKSFWETGATSYAYTVRHGEIEGAAATCTSYSPYDTIIYSDQQGLSIPMTFYSQSNLVYPYNINDYLYYPLENKLLFLDSTGTLTEIVTCTTSPAYTFYGYYKLDPCGWTYSVYTENGTGNFYYLDAGNYVTANSLYLYEFFEYTQGEYVYNKYLVSYSNLYFEGVVYSPCAPN